jgi:hypothetical protein
LERYIFDVMSYNADCRSRGGNNRWAPLSYPSASIFSSPSSRDEFEPLSAARVANPFFPLHRDVLFAAVRELFIIDGKIDFRNMEITNLDTHSNIITNTPGSVQCENTTAALLSDDEGNVDEFRLKKRRIQVTTTDSLPTLHEQKCSQDQPHIVPNAEHFDYSRFRDAEALVSHVVDRAISHVTPGPGSSNEHDDTSPTTSIQTAKKSITVGSHLTSKRKVSDAEDLDHDQEVNLGFSTEILSLVRSNIMLLRKSASGTALTKLNTHHGNEFHHSNASNLDEIYHAMLNFLRYPKPQGDQKQGKICQTRFILPHFLDVSIDSEHSLRAKAQRMISSMVNSIPGNDMNTSLRAFLGYRSSKSPTRERIVGVVADVLFDVSHAMYAWIHTHDKLLRSQGKDIADAAIKNYSSMDVQIKSSLFDDRALKRIGGFEPESLLPLSLGIRRCRLANVTWEQYAISNEGMRAMSVHHTSPQVEFLGEPNNEEKMYPSRRRKRQSTGFIVVNNSLIEIGKKRRGRRGKSVQSLHR